MDRHTDPQYKTEDGNALRIWSDAAPNNFLTEQLGRPIFDEVVMVEVIAPGSGNSTPIFEVIRKFDKAAKRSEPKYGLKYQEYKRQIEDFLSDRKADPSMAGTPLSEWPEISRTMIAELKAAKIFTVDMLASLPDTRLGVVGPDGRTWRDKALAFLENAKGSVHATKLAAELSEANRKNDDLQSQVSALASKIAEMEASASTGAAPPAAPPADAAAAIDGMDGKPGNGMPII